MNTLEILERLENLKGKSIALIYSFRNEDSDNFRHYDYWKADVITEWLAAIEHIGCIPYICDVRTFSTKALEKTLPTIHYAINLNAGNYTLENLSLVHSICGASNITCIPNQVCQLVTGEHKHYTNLIALALGLNVPKYIPEGETSISRPINLGSSSGVGLSEKHSKGKITQEFIQGYDITTPCIFDPHDEKFKILPSIYYVSDSKSPKWFHSNITKNIAKGYKKKFISLGNDAEDDFMRLIENFGVRDYCRIDCRIQCSSYNDLLDKVKSPLSKKDLFFLEINAMPTIKKGTTFVQALEKSDDNYKFKKTCNDFYGNSSEVPIVLASALISASQ
jgi:hypothetical protein